MKKLLYFILGFTLTASLQAQEVRQAFINMPDSILPILTKVNRADCIDFLDSHMRAIVKNRFDLLHNLHTKTTTNIGLINQTKKYSKIKFPLKNNYSIITLLSHSDNIGSKVAYFDVKLYICKRIKKVDLPLLK